MSSIPSGTITGSSPTAIITGGANTQNIPAKIFTIPANISGAAITVNTVNSEVNNISYSVGDEIVIQFPAATSQATRYILVNGGNIRVPTASITTLPGTGVGSCIVYTTLISLITGNISLPASTGLIHMKLLYDGTTWNLTGVIGVD